MKHIVHTLKSKFSPAALLVALALVGAVIGGVAYAGTRDIDHQHTQLAGWCHVSGCSCKAYEGSYPFDCRRCGHLHSSH